MYIRKKLVVADTKLADAQRLVPFSLVNPENTNTVRKKFLRKSFNPEFHYPDMPDFDKMREAVQKLKIPRRTVWGKLLLRERDHLLQKLNMFQAIGTPQFGKLAKLVYGSPDTKLVKKAEELVKLPKAQPGVKIRYTEARALLKKTFDMLGFRYTMRRKEMVTSASISPSSRLLLLRAKERFSRSYTYRLAVHEIATHALRAENGRKQKLGIFCRGTANYLGTEEGLAAYNEERAGVMNTTMLKNYAGRVLAVHYSQKHTFVETYKLLLRYFDKQDAFKLTLRAKRGLGNGDSLGACTKDHVYLKGYMEVKDFVAKGGEIDLLHAGKISIADLGLVRKKLVAPAHIPNPVIEWIRHDMVKA